MRMAWIVLFVRSPRSRQFFSYMHQVDDASEPPIMGLLGPDFYLAGEAP
jgi:hypothetical protein